MAPQLEALAKASSELKLRVVDIADWKSPVARQYGIDRLPTLWLYENGKLYSKDRKKIAARLESVK